jgi:hypothetical protein
MRDIGRFNFNSLANLAFETVCHGIVVNTDHRVIPPRKQNAEKY